MCKSKQPQSNTLKLAVEVIVSASQLNFTRQTLAHEHVLEIYNKPDFRRLREKLNTRLEADPCRRCGFL